MFKSQIGLELESLSNQNQAKRFWCKVNQRGYGCAVLFLHQTFPIYHIKINYSTHFFRFLKPCQVSSSYTMQHLLMY